MGKFIDILGQRFGRLTVLSPAPPDANRRTRWLVRCDCGTEKIIDGAHMRYGKIQSCGCLLAEILVAKGHSLAPYAGQNRTHGMSRRKEYFVWKTMHQRCRNPRNKDFAHYGGRGISVCERWAKFENFYADMGQCPPGLTLDRKDNDGNYEPENCRWATQKDQNNNSRRWRKQ